MTGSDGKRRLANATPAIWPRQYFETQIRLAILSGEFGAGDKVPGVADGSFVRGGADPPQNMIKEYPCHTADH